MKLKKELGQNFLTNQVDIKNFIEFCSFKKSDIVLEIGPGNGALSKHIVSRVSKVIGIELDPSMTAEIEKLQISNYEVRNENFLDINLNEIIEKDKVTKIIGAIPYYISSPIVHKVIESATTPLTEVYLITQKEFAQKLIGNKNKRSYFTNLIEKYATTQKGAVIKKESFNPVPKVDSLYFKISFNSYPLNKLEVKNWSKFLHHVFNTPRKKINKRFDKKLLSEFEIDENLRPENLNIEQIQLLYNKLNDQ